MDAGIPSTAAAALLAAVLLAGCDGAGDNGQSMLAPGQEFAFRLEQDGKVVPQTDGLARLRRAPFSLVIDFRKLGGVFINASPNDVLYRTAVAGDSLEEALPFEARERTPIGTLLVAPDRWDHWYVMSPRTHKFGTVQEEQADGLTQYIRCTRRIERYIRPDMQSSADLWALPSDTLYLVMVLSEREAEQLTEKQRAAVVLRFE